MDRVEFRRSRAKSAKLAVIGLALVGASWFLAQSADGPLDKAVGWFGVVFFGAALLLSLKRMLEGGVAYVFDSGGIEIERGPVRRIPWSELQGYSVVSVRRNRFLAVTLRDPELFFATLSPGKRKLAAFNKRMGWGDWTFSFTGVSPGLDAAVDFIRQNVGNLAEAPD
ncbi:MAG: STM3941 family protein [Thermoanaerobaculia bacterium]